MEDNMLKKTKMIKASNEAGLTRTMLSETFKYDGIMGCYNLGLEHMFNYFQKHDRTKAVKPDLWGDGYADGHLVYDMYDCPNCGKEYELDYEQYDYCPNCGQKLDWTVLEGEETDECS